MTAALRHDVAPAVQDASAADAQYPPRVPPVSWPQTEQSREIIFDRLLAPPFRSPSAEVRRCARRGLTVLLDWLAVQPGDTWQRPVPVRVLMKDGLGTRLQRQRHHRLRHSIRHGRDVRFILRSLPYVVRLGL